MTRWIFLSVFAFAAAALTSGCDRQNRNQAGRLGAVGT